MFIIYFPDKNYFTKFGYFYFFISYINPTRKKTICYQTLSLPNKYIDNYMVANDIDDDRQVKALLLHFCGEELHSIFGIDPD